MLKKYVFLLFLCCSLSFSAFGQGFQVYDQVVGPSSSFATSWIKGLAELNDSTFVASFQVGYRMVGINDGLAFYNSKGESTKHFSPPLIMAESYSSYSLLEPLPNGSFLTNYQGLFLDTTFNGNIQASTATGRFTANFDTVWINGHLNPVNTFSELSFIDSTNFITLKPGGFNTSGEFCRRNAANQTFWCFNYSKIDAIKDSLVNSSIENHLRFKDFKATADSFYVHLAGTFSNFLLSFSNSSGTFGKAKRMASGFKDFQVTPFGIYAFYQKTNPFLPSLKTLEAKLFNFNWQEQNTLNLSQWLTQSETPFLDDIYASYNPVNNTLHAVYGQLNNWGAYELGLLAVDTSGALLHKTSFGNFSVSYLPVLLRPARNGGIFIGLAQKNMGYQMSNGPSIIIKIDQNGSISTTELPTAQKLILYPNPAKDHFYLQGLKPNSTVNRIALLNLNGQLIADLPTREADAKIELPAKVKSGLYLLQVYTDEGQSTQKLQVLRR